MMINSYGTINPLNVFTLFYPGNSNIWALSKIFSDISRLYLIMKWRHKTMQIYTQLMRADKQE